MKNKSLSIRNVYNFTVALIFIELVLGGLGHLFGLPIRKGLFAVGIVFSLYMIYKEKIKISNKFIIPIVIVTLYAVYGSVIGLIKGNSLGDIFSDANTFLGIIYILLLIAYIKDSREKIYNIFNIFINCSVIVALLTIGLFFFSRIFLPDNVKIITEYNDLNRTLEYGLISGLVLSNNYARVYLYNGIFMQLAVSLLMIRILNKNHSKKAWDIVKLSIIAIGIYVSNTRGFWVGTLGVVVLVVMYFLFRRVKDKLSIKLAVIPILVLIIVNFGISKTIVAPKNNNVPVQQETLKDRVDSIVDFENDLSNKVRAVQLKFLLENFKEAPILGAGFGAHIYEYTEYSKANNLPGAALSSNFELYYVELLFKTGIVGITIFFGYMLLNFIKLIQLIFVKKMNSKDEQILVAWSIGTMSILGSSITNPYIAGLSVFFVLVMEVYLIQLYSEKYS